MTAAEQIYTAFKKDGAPDGVAENAVKQAMVEAANFKSNVFLTDNNAFGMKMPSKRKSPYIERASTIAVASEGGIPYAHYKTVADSAHDLVNWMQYKNIQWNELYSDDPAQTELVYARTLDKFGYYGPDSQTYAAMMRAKMTATMKAIMDVINRHQGITIAAIATLGAMATFFIVRKLIKNKK